MLYSVADGGDKGQRLKAIIAIEKVVSTCLKLATLTKKSALC
ncbi:hypothetical protein N476_06600 [Pseudoalteromonas luteoviolacea H33]|uniref:Uncharacterized protein n=1 Tax=Pseudoalteromonas luteoviolacea H33 TaxID=1365251 RepID=A0A167GQK0_9GAMM|nr:hypothetical protein N476_06600 [Pseudoalteromonas luteoviolacea H33]KZN76998.1 hypothetical protein N477_13555 [Pseudoalteromonas luteoviolacea H33-S]